MRLYELLPQTSSGLNHPQQPNFILDKARLSEKINAGSITRPDHIKTGTQLRAWLTEISKE